MATTDNGERLVRRICWVLAAAGLALLAVTVAQAGPVPQSAMGATVGGAAANSGAVLAAGEFGAARPDAMTVGVLLTGVVMWVTERRLWAR